MFTGIIREIGTISAIDQHDGGARITVEAPRASAQSQIGSSVAINGTCLTVVEQTPTHLSFDVMQQSLALTTLSERTVGDQVNTEPSMRVGDELGGHFLYGHVDNVATVRSIKNDGDATLMQIEPPKALMRYIAPQGSVAIDGISLTIAQCHDTSFTVSLIAHTMQETNLSERSVGDHVNIEVDMMMKYVVSAMEQLNQKEA